MPRRFRRPLLALLLILAALAPLGPTPTAAQAPAETPALPASLDGFLAAYAEADAFAGAALVARGDKVLLAGGYGEAHRDRAVANTAATRFQVGSVTKGFTAAAVMRLEEAGRLSVDDPIADYLPAGITTARAGVEATIHHLLSHTSGVGDFVDDYDPRDPEAWPASLDALVADFGPKPLEFTPGTRYAYSNSGYVLLGLIIERVTGEPFAGHLARTIFRPLGMAATDLAPPDPADDATAVGYVDLGDGTILDVSAFGRTDLAHAAGGITSTVGDLHRWVRALAAGEVVSPATLARMLTPVRDGYGYGWRIDGVAGHRSVGHNGTVVGFRASLAWFPDDDAVVIVLSNRGDAPADRIDRGLAQILFG